MLKDTIPARLVVHSLVIPIYYLCASLIYEVVEADPTHLLLTCIPLFLSTITALYWHNWGTWSNHPLAKVLAAHAGRPQEWQSVANALATEFRRVDKFVHGKSWGKVVVTDNWIVRCGLYTVNAAYQPDVHLTIKSTDEYVDPETRQTTQFINITVSSINSACSDFNIRLLSTDYTDLCTKVSGVILNIRNIVFQQTLSDRFEEAFRDEVIQNGLYLSPREREECIGCLHAISDVKLSKMCDEPEVGGCKGCLCRPMWCMRCLAKWFANRQDKDAPGKWLSGTAPCPTCRSKFCIRDVQMLANS